MIIKFFTFSLFMTNIFYAAEKIPRSSQVHTSLMSVIADKNITSPGDFFGLNIEIEELLYTITKVAFLDDRQHTEAPVSFHETMRTQICYALIHEDEKWSYFYEHHTSHNTVLKTSDAAQSSKLPMKEDRCKFFGEMTPVLFSYNTRVEGGGIFIGFKKIELLKRPHLSADDIHKALLPRTIEAGSEVMIEGIIYIVKEYIVVDEREDKTTSFNEEFSPDNCEYDLQHPESNECKHFLANSPSVIEDVEGIPPLQQLVGLTGKHEYHYHIKSRRFKSEVHQSD